MEKRKLRINYYPMKSDKYAKQALLQSMCAVHKRYKVKEKGGTHNESSNT